MKRPISGLAGRSAYIMSNKLIRFFEIAPHDRKMLFEALVFLLFARVALKTLKFKHIAGFFEHQARNFPEAKAGTDPFTEARSASRADVPNAPASSLPPSEWWHRAW